MADLDLLVVGDANPDLVLSGGDVEPRFGQGESLAGDAALTLGGSAAITAAGAAQLGLRTAFAGVVGDDLFGRFVLDVLGERGIDTRGCVVEEDLPTGVTVVLSKSADRASITSAGCTFSMTGAQLDRDILRSARHIHTSMYFFFRKLAPDLPSLFSEARAAGLSTSLDPHGDRSGKWDSGIRSALGVVDVFLPNEMEACGISGETDVVEAARSLAAEGPLVVVKRGAEGALACDGVEVTQVIAPPFPVVDATGAGDSFNAGFIAGRLNDWPLERCLSLAVACGSLSTRAAGGVDAQPSLAEATLAMGEPA